MPLYEYECDACGRRFEMIQRFSDPPQETCITCGGPVHKLISSSAIQFKGTGWYVTDYAAKDKARASSSGDTETKSGDTDKKTAAPSSEPAKSSPSSESSSPSSSDTSASAATKSS